MSVQNHPAPPPSREPGSLNPWALETQTVVITSFWQKKRNRNQFGRSQLIPISSTAQGACDILAGYAPAPQNSSSGPSGRPTPPLGEDRDNRVQAAPEPGQTNAQGEPGGREDGEGSGEGEGIREKGVTSTELPSPLACSPSSRDGVRTLATPARLCAGRRPGGAPPRGPHLREPRPRSAHRRARDHVDLLPASSADTGKRSRAGASRALAGAPGQWAGIPGTRALCWGTGRARERAMWPDPGIPLGGAVHQATSARRLEAGVRPSGF